MAHAERDIQVPMMDRTCELWPLNEVARVPARRYPQVAAGHRHLYDLLWVHDVVRRRGVANAARLLSSQQLDAAIAACTYFEMPDLATAIAGIPWAARSARSARAFDAWYRRFCKTSTILTAIRHKIANGPDDIPGRAA